MAAISVDDLDKLIEKGKELKALLEKSPEITAFAKAVADNAKPVLVVDNDRLILAGEAASILGVNKSTIGRYIDEGLLNVYYVPHSSRRRFKLSEVWGALKHDIKEAGKE